MTSGTIEHELATGDRLTNRPVFTVVTPLFNKPQSINRAINSVLSQTFENFEYIVVDDGSTDESPQRVQEFSDPRLQLLQQANRGASSARNLGIQHARTELIAFLDADDTWEPEFLSVIYELTRSYPEAGAFASGYFVKQSGKEATTAFFPNVPHGRQGGIISSYFAVAANGKNPMWSSAVCLRKSTLVELDGFPEGVRVLEDLHLWARVAMAVPIAYNARPLATYFRDAENRRGPVASSVSDLSFCDAINAAIESGELDTNNAKHAQEFVNHYLLFSAFKTLLAGRNFVARNIAQSVHCNKQSHTARKWLVVVMSFFPSALNQMLWRAGKVIKTILGQ